VVSNPHNFRHYAEEHSEIGRAVGWIGTTGNPLRAEDIKQYWLAKPMPTFKVECNENTPMPDISGVPIPAGTRVWVPVFNAWATIGESLLIQGIAHWRLNEFGAFAHRGEFQLEGEKE
jgi:hypothetical protein